MRKALRLVLGLSLLCTSGLFAANLLDAGAPGKDEAPAIEAAPTADSSPNDSPMIKTVFDPKKNNVDSADCVVGCRASYRFCRNGCASGDTACYNLCWDDWQDCKQGCSFQPPNECWPDPFPCGPCPIEDPDCNCPVGDPLCH